MAVNDRRYIDLFKTCWLSFTLRGILLSNCGRKEPQERSDSSLKATCGFQLVMDDVGSTWGNYRLTHRQIKSRTVGFSAQLRRNMDWSSWLFWPYKLVFVLLWSFSHFIKRISLHVRQLANAYFYQPDSSAVIDSRFEINSSPLLWCSDDASSLEY